MKTVWIQIPSQMEVWLVIGPLQIDAGYLQLIAKYNQAYYY